MLTFISHYVMWLPIICVFFLTSNSPVSRWNGFVLATCRESNPVMFLINWCKNQYGVWCSKLGQRESSSILLAQPLTYYTVLQSEFEADPGFLVWFCESGKLSLFPWLSLKLLQSLQLATAAVFHIDNRKAMKAGWLFFSPSCLAETLWVWIVTDSW